jgi:hypothetical protein
MKNNCRKAVAALALALVLTSSAFADDGEIHTGSPATQSSPTVEGEIHTGATDSIIYTDGADALVDIGLSLLQTLSRF